jgi:small subunit ribosomal protein S15
MAETRPAKKSRTGSYKQPEKAARWVDYKPKEVEDLVIKHAKQGAQAAQIGLILRDQYGVPSVKSATGKTINKILRENELQAKLPDDLMNLLRRVVELRVHLERNKRDYQSYRGLELAEAKIRNLAKYYVKKGVLPKGWKYDAEQAKLLIR